MCQVYWPLARGFPVTRTFRTGTLTITDGAGNTLELPTVKAALSDGLEQHESNSARQTLEPGKVVRGSFTLTGEQQAVIFNHMLSMFIAYWASNWEVETYTPDPFFTLDTIVAPGGAS